MCRLDSRAAGCNPGLPQSSHYEDKQDKATGMLKGIKERSPSRALAKLSPGSGTVLTVCLKGVPVYRYPHTPAGTPLLPGEINLAL